MKTTTYRIVVLLLIIPLFSFSNYPIKGKYKKTKNVSKTYNTNDDTIINLKNKYGNIDIVTWDKNSIEIDVTITVSGNNESKVEDKLKTIHIDFDKNSNQVYAITKIGKSKSWSSSWFSWDNSSNMQYQIDYKVKMPINNVLNVTNDYGSIILDELNGKANIDCDYGKIIIGNLNNLDNEINIDYTNHSVIAFMEGGTINADYSSFTVENGKNIKLNADYTKSKFENINNLEFNCDYGSLKVDELNNVNGNGDYLSISLGDVYKTVNITTDYGSIKINELKNGFEKVNINADYTGVRIGINKDASCNIQSDLSYGSFKYDGNFTFNKKKVKSTSKEYRGFFNSNSSSSIIITDTDYGNVKLFEK